MRTVIPTTSAGGSFHGVLTGGNGRSGAPAQGNYYAFNVPKGATNLHADITLANDPSDVVTAYLIDPSGDNLGYSTNVTLTGGSKPQPESTRSVDLYHARPASGRWTLVLQWANAVSGLELPEPFTGTISFAKPHIYAKLPRNGRLKQGKTFTYKVTVHNTGKAPEAYVVDPRLHTSETLTLANQNGSVNAASMTLPLAAGLTFPYYIVPTHTTQLNGSITGSVPVTFDSGYFPGDPDVGATSSGDSASLTLSEPEVSPGLWDINPAEIGPFGASGAPAATASASMTAVTKAFDPAVTSSTGDIWSFVNGVTSTLAPVYIPVGGSATITVKIHVTGSVGSSHAGILFVDDITLAGFSGVFDNPNGDEIAALPYSYQITK